MFHSEGIAVSTRGRGTIEITEHVARIIDRAGIARGICNVFIHHTSASLILGENADSDVRSDLERFFARIVPDGDPLFRHTLEGPDDMPAHVRSVLTQASISIPVDGGRLDLGTWQGLFLYEHRTAPHRRRVTVSAYGDPP